MHDLVTTRRLPPQQHDYHPCRCTLSVSFHHLFEGRIPVYLHQAGSVPSTECSVKVHDQHHGDTCSSYMMEVRPQSRRASAYRGMPESERVRGCCCCRCQDAGCCVSSSFQHLSCHGHRGDCFPPRPCLLVCVLASIMPHLVYGSFLFLFLAECDLLCVWRWWSGGLKRCTQMDCE